MIGDPDIHRIYNRIQHFIEDLSICIRTNFYFLGEVIFYTRFKQCSTFWLANCCDPQMMTFAQYVPIFFVVLLFREMFFVTYVMPIQQSDEVNATTRKIRFLTITLNDLVGQFDFRKMRNKMILCKATAC